MSAEQNAKDVAPEERSITIRQEIQQILQQGERSASDLSKMVRKSEKEVYGHLEHLISSGSIKIIPAMCNKCEYTFEERKKSKKPSKCPQCKSTHIEPAMFVSV